MSALLEAQAGCSAEGAESFCSFLGERGSKVGRYHQLVDTMTLGVICNGLFWAINYLFQYDLVLSCGLLLHCLVLVFTMVAASWSINVVSISRSLIKSGHCSTL
jgi:hypothetical protein